MTRLLARARPQGLQIRFNMLQILILQRGMPEPVMVVLAQYVYHDAIACLAAGNRGEAINSAPAAIMVVAFNSCPPYEYRKYLSSQSGYDGDPRIAVIRHYRRAPGSVAETAGTEDALLRAPSSTAASAVDKRRGRGSVPSVPVTDN
jgi:hypothetical protein